MKRQKALALILLFQIVFSSIAPLAPRAYAGNMNADAGNIYEAEPAADDETATRKGLRFRLSEGAEQAEKAGPQATVAQATKLSESETARVLERLPPMKVEASDEQDFALRERSLPAPRAGATVLQAFPSVDERRAPDEGAGGEVKVLRYSPQGDVPLAPQLSLTFSQPMVAVTSQEEAARTVPASLSPLPAGRWRWLGTKTLIFDPADERLPMATEYTVTVPAGTRSANGGATKTPVAWKFSTPPPKLTRRFPENVPVRRDAIIFLEFDQRVDPGAVLRTVSVRGGAAALRVRLATDVEIAADENVKRLANGAVKGRWLALRAVSAGGEAREALPPDSGITVTVGPGTPSAEGPRTTTAAQSFSFRTYGALRVTNHQCGWNKTCTPFDHWRITFSNPLDLEAFAESQVKIEPAVPDVKISIYGSEMYINGAKRGRTTYKVTLAPSIRDQFGQTLQPTPPLTFNVGVAPAYLSAAGGNFVTLDPAAGQPRFSVFSVNHASLKVSLYAVTPDDWERYIAYMKTAYGYYDEKIKKPAPPPGKLVSTKAVQVAGQPDEMTETRIDITPALKNGLGSAFVIVEPTVKRREREAVRAWAQVTNIGLDAFVDREDLVGWATSLKDGQTLAGVEMWIAGSTAKATSGDDGLVRLSLPAKSGASTGLLVAHRGGDVSILPERGDWWGSTSGWVRREVWDELRWYVFDDRKMYRPNEEVSVKGWIRRVGAGKTGDVGALAGASDAVYYRLNDSRGNEVTKGTARVNALGGFDLKLKLPPTMNLGNASLHLEAQGLKIVATGQQHQHYFQVQEFRRPEFEVSAKTDEGPYFVGGHAQATVAASYYAGGGLPNSEVNWRVTATQGHFTPPNRGDYTFGKWTPWWETFNRYGNQTTDNTQTFKGTTDAAGKHILRVDFDSVNPPQPSSVTAEASVTDVNRQTWTATTTMLVHPADLYVGLRSERYFVQQGQPLVVNSIVTDLDGKLIAGREIKMRAALLEWKQVKGVWKQVESKVEECSVKSGADDVKCTFRPKTGGVYRVNARIYDDRERANESELTLWVAGGKQPPRREVAQEKAELIPDRKEYRAGDVAEILVQSPFIPAEGVLTLRRSGLIRTERFRMNEPSHTLKIPLEEAYTPNIHVQVDLVGAAARVDDKGEADEKLPKRPAFASGALNISVPPLARKLAVTATPREKALEPGGETIVSVEVKDASGRPVQGSELAVVVVDESVLALTGYKLTDPMSVFYSDRGADV
ncbi:MAG TPA: Ig-like domain-containing protein, partial [Pyrinomonadaceae bacterium]|nr:Ig-like domain-containing protein [Pyrinomonadaceae bacterium]